MSANISIGRLKPGISHQTLELSADDLNIESSDVLEVSKCTVEVDFDRHEEEIYVKGRADVRLKIECARCLEPFERDSVHELAFVIRLSRRGDTSGTESESSDDYFILDDSSQTFDLAPLVREKVVLSLPLKPLCSDDCKGICAICGANKNISPCDCREDVSDERWSGLLKLKEKAGGK